MKPVASSQNTELWVVRSRYNRIVDPLNRAIIDLLGSRIVEQEGQQPCWMNPAAGSGPGLSFER
jgi:hypothetical protein